MSIGKGVYESRIKNSRRNIFSGLVKQLLSIGLQFAIRTIIVYFLGSKYQGVNGLFTSILSVLNLSDLGFGAAVTYMLYKPIAEKNQVEINSVLLYLKRVYCIIGIVVLSLGVLIMPLLPMLVSGEYPSDINVYLLFLIYVIDVAISYFLFGYKNALLTAYQREDLVSNAYSISLVLSRGLQIVLLLVFRNYYAYAVILPLSSLANNLLVQYYSNKYFSDSVPSGNISLNKKKELNKKVIAVFVNRASDVARNSFDNIVLSAYFGLVTVAAYGNYFYIYSAIIGVMSIFAHGVKASVGNSIELESVKKNHDNFKTFTFIFMWLAGWCSVCLFCLYQPFMNIWMRGESSLILSYENMSLFCVYFYAMCMTYSKNTYLEAKGLYNECEKLYIIEAIANLILNLVLGSMFGITGVLIATIFTICIFNFWGGTRILFMNYFVKGFSKYLITHLLYLVITVFVAIFTNIVCGMITSNGNMGFVIKSIICLVLPNLLYLLFYFRCNQFKKTLIIIKSL